MLIRICLIVALVTGLAAIGLNILEVKPKITTLQANLKEETRLHHEFQNKYTVTKKDLDKTTAELKQTKTELAATTAAKERAETQLAAQTKRADKLTEDLAKTRQDLADKSAQLEAYKVTGVTPAQILTMNRRFKDLQDNLAVSEDENKVLARTLKKVKNELARYVSPEKHVFLPASLKGKILVADPKWNFVVLNVGENQGVLKYGELLVNRDGRLVAKVIVSSVEKDRCIANVMPGWELGEVMEGDQVIPAYPAS